MKKSRSGVFLWLLGLVLLFVAKGPALSADVPRMSTDDLKARLGEPEVVVLDVRTPADWEGSQWKIQGAVREDPFNTDAWAEKYPKDKRIVLYCA